MDGFVFPWGMSGQEIYDNFKGGQGPAQLEAAGREIQKLIANYEQRRDSITKLTGQMESAWRGDSAGAAQRGAGPLAVEHGVAAPEMNTAQELIASQATVYRFADATVVPVPAVPERPGFWDNVLSLGEAGQNYESQMTQVNAANDRNIAIMGTYEDVTSTNTSRMPTSYGSITPDHSAIGVQERKDPPAPPPPRRQPPGTVGDPGQTNNVGSQVRQPPGPGGDQLLGPHRPPQQHQPPNPQQTDPNDFLPPGGPKPPGPGPVPGPGPGPGPNPPFTPAFFGPPGFGPTGGGGGYADSSSRGGPGSSGARGFGGTAGPPGEEGRGARGLGPGAAAAEAAAGRGGGVGMRGGAGMGGMPMGAGGGARGQGSEDGEHQRPSYLVEGDPDETFGTDEVTAPPVIGE